MTKIRLSPSGPVIQNANGTPLEFGAGAELRRGSASFRANPYIPAAASNLEVSSTLDGTTFDFRAALDGIRATSKLKIRAELMLVHYAAQTTANNTMSFNFEVANGADDTAQTWTGFLQNSAVLCPTNIAALEQLTTTVAIESQVFEPGDLSGYDSVGNPSELWAYLKIAAGSADANGNQIFAQGSGTENSARLSLIEVF